MGIPGYVRLAETGELRARVDRARAALRSCRLCPRACSVDRESGERGYCTAAAAPRVFRHMAHHGEEPPVSGTRGSGAVFFSHCTMRCGYCQNHRMSHSGEGRLRTAEEIAAMIASLAGSGCHNLNLVTGTPHIAGILEALLRAARLGVSLPVVWNSSGYESRLGLELLDGVADVYLVDARYSSDEAAARHSDAPDYVSVNRKALLEMRRQVGTLKIDARGLALSGLIVRHLVLPGGASGAPRVLRFVSDALGKDTFVSLMAQYYPAHLSKGSGELCRRISRAEWDDAVAALRAAGLTNGWIQEYHEATSPMAGTEIEPDSDDPLTLVS